MINMNHKIRFSLLTAFAIGVVLTFAFPPPKEANAQVFGPTTRTPQLVVSPGPTTVENLTVNGACTGCGLSMETGTFDITFTGECSNGDFVWTIRYTKIGEYVSMYGGGFSTQCNSASTTFQTAAAVVPSNLRPPLGGRRFGHLISVQSAGLKQEGVFEVLASGQIRLLLCNTGASGACANTWLNDGLRKGLYTNDTGVTMHLITYRIPAFGTAD